MHVICKPKVLHVSTPPTPLETKAVHFNDKPKFELHAPYTPVKKAAKVVVERSFLCRALLMVGKTRPTSKMSVTT